MKAAPDLHSILATPAGMAATREVLEATQAIPPPVTKKRRSCLLPGGYVDQALFEQLVRERGGLI